MLSDRELATVLAALRFWQICGPAVENGDRYTDAERENLLNNIKTNGGVFDPLSTTEIDELCERLNFDRGIEG